MKINVLPIVLDHLGTLRDDRTKKYSLFDFLLFYAIPVACAGAPFLVGIIFAESFYNISITFFGIFIALLLNVQVATFGIFQRKWEIPSDENLVKIQREKLEERRSLLGELNSNLSYLVLVCCISLFVFLIFIVFSATPIVASAITCSLYAHFLLTMMMTVKRAHTLFQMEYEGHC